MFISRVKAKGNYYFYAYVYDNSNDHGLKTVHSFGKKDKALSQISAWRDKSKIPKELLAMGLRLENLDNWRKKIEEV